MTSHPGSLFVWYGKTVNGDDQQNCYENEWARIKLSEKPGKSGWGTLILAPDFTHFEAKKFFCGVLKLR